jgi:hypothetical protein
MEAIEKLLTLVGTCCFDLLNRELRLWRSAAEASRIVDDECFEVREKGPRPEQSA